MQIAERRDGPYEVLEHVGTARSEAELAVLIQVARSGLSWPGRARTRWSERPASWGITPVTDQRVRIFLVSFVVPVPGHRSREPHCQLTHRPGPASLYGSRGPTLGRLNVSEEAARRLGLR